MKNLIIFTLCSLFTTTAFSETLLISRTNHSGYTLVDYLEKNNDGYSISGFNLGTKLTPQTQKYWNQTFEIAAQLKTRKIASSCESGQYKIVHEKAKNQTRVMSGCYNEPSYRQMIGSIKALRKEAQLANQNKGR